MRLILTEDVSNLGTIGNIVKVKDGYARNYLLPRSLAVVANESNRKELEHRQRVLAAKKKKVIDELQGIAKQIERAKVSISKQVGEEEKIFGSVTTAELVAELAKANIDISKKDVKILDEVKKLGKYSAEVKLHPEVVAKFSFKVVAQEAPAE